MKLSVTEFLNCGPRTHEFDNLLQSSLATRTGLEVSLVDDTAKIEPLECQPSSAVTVIGVSYVAGAGVRSIGARLILPLISSIYRIGVPSRQVYALRRHERSIADFFARNLFFALTRPNDAACEITAASNACEETRLQTEFSRRYLWIMRTDLAEPILHDRNIIERLLINARLKTITFKSGMLESGADEIRGDCPVKHEKVPPNDRFDRLMSVRRKMMAYLK